MLPWTRKIHFFKKNLILLAILGIFCFSFFAGGVLAQSTDVAGDPVGVNAVDNANIALSGVDIRTVIVRIINTLLALLGIVAVSLILYAGFLIMTSGGDEAKVDKGRKIMVNAVIGLVVILSAFAIVRFITGRFFGNSGFNTGKETTGPGAPEFTYFSGSGALGTIIKDHYPFRDQKDVARNSAIVVTFNVPIDPSTVAENSNNTCWNNEKTGPTNVCDFNNGSIPYYGDCYLDGNDNMLCDTLKTENVKIDTLANIDNTDAGVPATVVLTYDQDKNVYNAVFRPVDYLGSSSQNVDYVVKLLGGITLPNSTQSIFSGLFDKMYSWNFQTGTNLDLSPPHVVNVSPAAGTGATKDRVIQINFSEAIDPTTVQGILSMDGEFDNILLNTTFNGVSNLEEGTWKISNGYKTIEFIPKDSCGVNSCGDVKYCLQLSCETLGCSQVFSGLIRTGAPTGNPNSPFEVKPFSGVYDLAFNGLDNLENNPAAGASYTLTKPPVVNINGSTKGIVDSEKNPDNFYWNFNIENRIDREAPYIVSVNPVIEGESVVGDTPVNINFSKQLLFDSIGNISIKEYPEHVCEDAAVNTSTPCTAGNPLPSLWFSTYGENINDKTKLTVRHREFGPNGLDLYYFTSIPYTLRDANQNCFYPGYGPKDKNQECNLEYKANGVVDTNSLSNCVAVSGSDSNHDTGCVYSNANTTSDVPSCLDILQSPSVSESIYSSQSGQ